MKGSGERRDMKPTQESYDYLIKNLHIFKGDRFSEAHIDLLMESIDELYEKAMMYEGLCK